MLVKDFMTRDVVTVQSSATVDEVKNLLAHSNFHRVPVMEGDKLVGLVNWHRLVGTGPVAGTAALNRGASKDHISATKNGRF